MKRQEAVDKQIEDIMDTFDFRRVYDVMKAIDWSWGLGSESHIPEEWELRKEARRLMIEASISGGSQSTGGFKAYCIDGIDIENEKRYVNINLSFELESTINDGEDYNDEE